MKKKSILAVIALLSASGAYAGVNERGIDLYRAELYDAAKIAFLSQSGGSPAEQAERYYYLGQTYYELQQTDSAAFYYAQSIATDPTYPFGHIGEGKLALAGGDAKGAEDLFKKANGLARKDPSVQTTIAETYIDFDKTAEAETALAKARKADKKYPGLYVAEGDAIAKAGDASKVGAAAGQYEQALYFDPNNKIALLKLARIYKSVNPNESLGYLDKLVAIDPEYIPAYALIGDVNRSLGKYPKAMEAYQKFINIPGVPILQRERYAQILYFSDQFDKSIEEINLVLAIAPDNVVMHRLRAWNNYKLANYPEALEQMTQFLKTTPEDQHIFLDYSTHGNILIKSKQPEAAVAAFQKAIELAADKDKANTYKDLADAYERNKNYPAAIEQYKNFFAIEKNPTVLDFYYYGSAIRSAAAKYYDGSGDEDEFKAFIADGEKAFAKVIELSPQSYLGYLSHAQLLALVDARTQAKKESVVWVAKPAYEKALEVMLANNDGGKRNSSIIEAYHYIGSHFLLAEDKENVTVYMKKILEIDPNDARAKQVLDVWKIKY
ncbi:TPR-domain containing protein [Candidatus Symbiothrix dinenymphae]|nr:TPR-domain containing protein [Candidatus Symbiothrix dinenymphae]